MRQFGKLPHEEGFHDLVENTQFTCFRGVEDGFFHALQGILDVEVPARLAARPVHRQRVAADGLDHKAVHHRAEKFVVVEEGAEPRVHGGFVGINAVNGSLHEVGHAQAPGADAEPHEVRIHDFGGVIYGTGLARKEKFAFPSLMLNLQPTFLDVDIGRSVFAHGSDMDDMRGGSVVFHREHQVIGDGQVVDQGEVRVFLAEHGVGCGRLFP